ncbi:hypothetical protein LTS08_001980 [Lithohypha guttulata]|nr:hypothetical protein LTS08_001980 [Lithohypha guttulata]
MEAFLTLSRIAARQSYSRPKDSELLQLKHASTSRFLHTSRRVTKPLSSTSALTFVQQRWQSSSESPRRTQNEVLEAEQEEAFLKAQRVQQPSISAAVFYFVSFGVFAFTLAAYSSLKQTNDVAEKLREGSLLQRLSDRFLGGAVPGKITSFLNRGHDDSLQNDFAQNCWGIGVDELKLMQMEHLMRAKQASEGLQWLRDRDIPASIKVPITQAYQTLANKVLNISISQQMILPILFVNTVVFILWTRSPWSARLTQFLRTNFLHRPSSGSTHTMLTSAFSHQAPFHFILNNFALWTFGGATLYHAIQQKDIKGNIPEASPVLHFLAFFATAGVFAAMTSHIGSAIRFGRIAQRLGLDEAKRTVGRTSSLGSSGAIYAVVAMTACTDPETRLSIILLPFFSFPIKYGVMGILALDVAGWIRGWRTFDHVAHLGGALFGFLYYQYGVQFYATIKQYVAKLMKVGPYDPSRSQNQSTS